MKAGFVLRCFRIVAAVSLLACGRCAPSIHDTHVPRRTTPLSRDNARLSFEVARPPFLIFYFGFEETAEKFRRGVWARSQYGTRGGLRYIPYSPVPSKTCEDPPQPGPPCTPLDPPVPPCTPLYPPVPPCTLHDVAHGHYLVLSRLASSHYPNILLGAHSLYRAATNRTTGGAV